MINIATPLLAAITAPNSLPQGDLTTDGLQNILAFVFALAGAIALLVIVVAGLRYTLSRGNPDSIKNSKDTIIYAMVGLLIAISGYSIVTFVVGHVK